MVFIARLFIDFLKSHSNPGPHQIWNRCVKDFYRSWIGIYIQLYGSIFIQFAYLAELYSSDDTVSQPERNRFKIDSIFDVQNKWVGWPNFCVHIRNVLIVEQTSFLTQNEDWKLQTCYKEGISGRRTMTSTNTEVIYLGYEKDFDKIRMKSPVSKIIW